jgi:hypothetical protein
MKEENNEVQEENLIWKDKKKRLKGEPDMRKEQTEKENQKMKRKRRTRG